MLVGKTEIDISELEYRAKDKTAFLEYSDSLVPADFKHIRSILDNQRYFCCLLLRTSGKVSWEAKNKLINSIMPDLSIVGFSDMLVEVSTLFGLVDIDKVNKFNRKESNGWLL